MYTMMMEATLDDDDGKEDGDRDDRQQLEMAE